MYFYCLLKRYFYKCSIFTVFLTLIYFPETLWNSSDSTVIIFFHNYELSLDFILAINRGKMAEKVLSAMILKRWHVMTRKLRWQKILLEQLIDGTVKNKTALTSVEEVANHMLNFFCATSTTCICLLSTMLTTFSWFQEYTYMEGTLFIVYL